MQGKGWPAAAPLERRQAAWQPGSPRLHLAADRPVCRGGGLGGLAAPLERRQAAWQPSSLAAPLERRQAGSTRLLPDLHARCPPPVGALERWLARRVTNHKNGG